MTKAQTENQTTPDEVEPGNVEESVQFIQQYFRWMLTVSVFYRSGPEDAAQIARGNVLYANTDGFLRLRDIQTIQQRAQAQFIDRGIITDGAVIDDVIIENFGMLGITTNEDFLAGALEMPPSGEPNDKASA